ncbi:hypothetical protein [Streptomyces litmocidini]|uniref:DUF4160 domain-containing protein n=1 Tax=Streptomyces litmocidini TaxID=67318 RepID=A0ABW7U4N2_9ACTN
MDRGSEDRGLGGQNSRLLLCRRPSGGRCPRRRPGRERGRGRSRRPGGPYREIDASAAFAVLVGQAAKPLAEQQAAAAQASAKEAAKAAADAKALADKAAGDAKIAAQAAATAAADAAKALEHAAAARASAAEAEKAAQAAKRADAKAQEYDVQAGVDAMQASFAANDAETEATAADQEATVAEREEERRAVKERIEADGSDVGPDLTPDDEELLRRECGEECVEVFRAAKALAGQGILDWLKENGGEILLEEIGCRDLERCFTEGDIESCLWTLVKFIPVSKAYAVGKAIIRVAGGIGGFLEKSVIAKRTLDKFRKIIDDAKKGKGRACPVKPKLAAVPAAAFAASAGTTPTLAMGAQALTVRSAAAASEFPGVGTIVSEGGVTIQIYSNDHAPPHAHVKGKEVRIGQNGKPLAGDPELSRLQKAVVDNNLRTIRENIRVAMERFKANGGC